MKKKYCSEEQEYTQFKNFRTGLFKYEGEKVLTCKTCGHLRTQSQKRINKSEMVHKPSQTKYKNMDTTK